MVTGILSIVLLALAVFEGLRMLLKKTWRDDDRLVDEIDPQKGNTDAFS